MIARIWHGWTTPQNADIYETLLREQVFPGIFAKNVDGFRRIELLRRPVAEEVEFTTIMWFATLQDVKAFAGDAYETAYVPDDARKVLTRYDATSQHHEVRQAHDV